MVYLRFEGVIRDAPDIYLQNHPLETQIGDVAAKAGRGGYLRLATGQLFLGAVVLSRTTRRVGRIR